MTHITQQTLDILGGVSATAAGGIVLLVVAVAALVLIRWG